MTSPRQRLIIRKRPGGHGGRDWRWWIVKTADRTISIRTISIRTNTAATWAEALAVGCANLEELS